MLMRAPDRRPGLARRGGSTSRARDEFAAEGATGLLYFVRRYCGEAPLRARVPRRPTTRRRCATRYVELLGDALKIEPSADRLPRRHRRGLLRHRLPARVGVRGAAARRYLREQFGSDWFTQREAGSLAARALVGGPAA